MKKLALFAALSLTLLSSAASADVRIAPGFRVAVAPPALRYEVAPVAPSPRHLWIAGHWAWRQNAHLWVPGRWALPPRPGYVWEPARWEFADGTWAFYEGSWRLAAPPPGPYEYEEAMPPAALESLPPAPWIEARLAPPYRTPIWAPRPWHHRPNPTWGEHRGWSEHWHRGAREHDLRGEGGWNFRPHSRNHYPEYEGHAAWHRQ
jgi:hypothetical protein